MMIILITIMLRVILVDIIVIVNIMVIMMMVVNIAVLVNIMVMAVVGGENAFWSIPAKNCECTSLKESFALHCISWNCTLYCNQCVTRPKI